MKLATVSKWMTALQITCTATVNEYAVILIFKKRKTYTFEPITFNARVRTGTEKKISTFF